ncbi:MAG TPA: histidine phosphatase family protein, partial [Erysipelotrichaceae bacterium]|nr:histidine phosphatase family protein [Erysipelotrichaceae bacterium]
MKKKVYLVRHGQTEFNVQKRCQGWKDSPLTKKGIEQALAICSWFEEQDI